MDELELLKKDWGKDSAAFKKLSAKEIYAMLQKKSSSLVRTLFYISIGELLFWILINSVPYFSSDSYKQRLETIYSNDHVFTALTVFSYGVILLFIFLLFKSYRAISVTDSAKKLMESILKTRKIIKYYVIYNLILAFVSVLITLYFMLVHDTELSHTVQGFNNEQLLIFFVVMAFFTALFIGLIWLFYRLLYGLLLKRLNKNYKELKALDM